MQESSTQHPRHKTKRSYAGMPPEERIARRRQQFMDAGRQLFGTMGYRKVTVRLLCAEAGLTDRYFYESFPSTEALLVAVYQEMIDHLEHTILVALATTSGETMEQRIKIGLDAFYQVAEDPLLSRVIWIEILGISPGIDAIYNQTLRRFSNLLFTLSQVMIPTLPVSEAVVRTAFMGLIGAVSETAKDWLHSDYSQSRETLVEGNMLLFSGLVAMVR
ncbi:TetR/AcrR family transcriptional regulator [Paraperlucidibaca wandonensis]|uniref:TetR/AcrR family transcriptional regulator n=1 Tax=Paraperlucidibaca wandonensis TaxID=1268273 RepID=A0ABW3HGZ2_9GAMM